MLFSVIACGTSKSMSQVSPIWQQLSPPRRQRSGRWQSLTTMECGTSPLSRVWEWESSPSQKQTTHDAKKASELLASLTLLWWAFTRLEVLCIRGLPTVDGFVQYVRVFGRACGGVLRRSVPPPTCVVCRYRCLDCMRPTTVLTFNAVGSELKRKHTGAEFAFCFFPCVSFCHVRFVREPLPDKRMNCTPLRVCSPQNYTLRHVPGSKVGQSRLSCTLLQAIALPS